MGAVLSGLRWGLDRAVSVGYGLLYDYIFERFGPYRDLQREIVDLVVAGIPPAVDRKDVRVLDIGCGAGNLALVLAEAGFSVVGVDAFDALVTLAQEKRRAERLPNLAFQHGDIALENPFREAQFDQVVNLHFLYAHPAPERVLEEAYRVLKPGGHAILVNLTRRVPVGPTFRRLRRERGTAAALHPQLWVLPNAVFEALRRRIGPHYWDEREFSRRLTDAGFELLALKRTFFDGASLLAWARKPLPPAAGDGHER
jgi:SAM-dependent methyltransferase